MREILIIGAGPAGLAAARAARARGASVTLLDAADDVGGQYWRHLPASLSAGREDLLHHGWATFTALRSDLDDDPGCRIVRGAQVWAIERGETTGRPDAARPDAARPDAGNRDTGRPDAEPAEHDDRGGHVVHALAGPVDGTDRERITLTPDALVLATGAHDRTLPFPGWDLPGVFTPGAAQALAKGERVTVGERVAVAGAGPFLLPVAASLVQTGTTVVGVFEASRARTLAAGWLSRPWRLARAGKKGAELAGYAAGQLRHRIPYRTGTAVIRAHGTDAVTAVTVAKLDRDWRPIPGTERRIPVDAVCAGHGFTPRLELAVAAGCVLTGDSFVAVDDAQRTSEPGVYAAGEITGIGGVELAMAEGSIAGHHAAGGDTGTSPVRAARVARGVHRDIARRIEAAHGIRPGWSSWLDDDTVICRCEEVRHGPLRDTAAATASTSLRSLKLSTRAGLGICQGRMCGRTVDALLRQHAPHAHRNDNATFDHRPLAFPLRLAELADHPKDNDRKESA
ncbi:NAD(P)/FAD-dependent oxidoreductase [Phytoactinopolyspora halophila]|uniref:NAD(P)/FAD-dependent oxidoreductase n=1 Tax=Phytoactinopolyspora halophila TaxID=1981511 RepID=UPI001B8CE3F2|nr:NAD(P)/FAD-dependent oxidoreductase [Phytoactinopolyspora halophila]